MKKTIVITGATGGIGYAAATALAKQGNDLILQGRDADKGKKIAAELSKLNGSSVRFISADLSTIAGIKNFAAEIKKLTDKIDVLIYSTGALNSDRRETKDGLNESFVVNYLCKFMLDNLLLDELKRAQGRIIIVGAPLMKGATINLDDLQMKTSYSLFKSMGQNMLAVHMHAQQFARSNGSAVPINVVHPGVVKTGIDRNVKGIMKILFTVFGPFIGNSVEKAVVNVIALANTGAKDTGYFYPKLAKPEVKEKINLDASDASKLWDDA